MSKRLEIFLSYIEIVRWKNLLFLFVTQKIIQYCIIYPLLAPIGLDDKHTLLYNLLSVSTILIAAGGYIINDYFDIKIDKINRPNDVIVGRKIDKTGAIFYYLIVTVLGTLLGIILSFWVKSYTLGFIFIVTPGLLWFYSSTYKRQLIVGNLIVSLSVALSIIEVAILSVAIIKSSYGNELVLQMPIDNLIYRWVGGFAGFSFLLTLIREIIKDVEDVEGDRELECRTIPIVWGVKRAKIAICSLILFVIATLLHIEYHYIDFEGDLTLKYILIVLVLPLILLAILVMTSKSKERVSQSSTLTKWIMAFGIFYGLLFYYLQAMAFNIPMFGIFLIK